MRPYRSTYDNYPDPSDTSPQMHIFNKTATTQNRTFNTSQIGKNKNRAKQIVSLHEQFEDLKKKIKEVENKNQKIIEKIHKQCNFKKKNPQTFDVISADNTAPIVYYQKNQKSQTSQVSGMSIDDSNKSDQSEYQFKQKKSAKKNSNFAINPKQDINPLAFSQSMQYPRAQPKMRKNNSQMDQQYRQRQTHDRKNHNRYQQQQYNNQSQYDEQSSQQIYEQNPRDSRGLFHNQEQMMFQQGKSNFNNLPTVKTHQHLKNPKMQHQSRQIQYLENQNYPISPQYPSTQTYMANSNVSQKGSSSSQKYNRKSLTPKPPQQQNLSESLQMYQLGEALKLQKQKILYLQNSLKKKEIQILSIKTEYDKIINYNQHTALAIQEQLENFMENVLKRGMVDIEKNVKRNENKLKNILINVKDSYEEHLSNKIIRENRLRRSNSRSKKDLSPSHNTSIHSAITSNKEQSHSGSRNNKVPRPGMSYEQLPIPQVDNNRRALSRSKNTDTSKKNKQFEQIVAKYEEMINGKILQINKLSGSNEKLTKQNLKLSEQIQSKTNQIKDLKYKMQELQKLMSQTYNEQPIKRYSSYDKSSPTILPKKKTSISGQTNLLQDIYQSELSMHETQFQLKYLQVKKQLQEKEGIIETLNNKLKKIEKDQANINNNNRLPPKRQKKSEIVQQEKIDIDEIQKSIKRQIVEKYNVQLQKKQQQIAEINERYQKLQKQIVEKDCIILSHQNKLKKYQSSHVINIEKIQQLEKLLKEEQNNLYKSSSRNQEMIDLLLLEKSICYSQLGGDTDRSQRRKTIKKADVQLLENQIIDKSEECLQLTKKLKMAELNLKTIEDKVNILQHQKIELQSQNQTLQMKLQHIKQNSQKESHQFEDQLEEESFNNEKSIRSRSQKAKKGMMFFSDLHTDQNQDNVGLSVENQQSKKRLQEQLQSLKCKHSQLSKNYNSLKSQHLQISRQKISLKKDNQYLTDSLADRQKKYQKFKKENQQLKIKINDQLELIKKKEDQLKTQKSQNHQKIKQLQKQWLEFQEEINRNNSQGPNENMQKSQIMKSSRLNLSQSSMLLTSTIHNKNIQYIQQQNEYLTIKLKQAQASLQIHNMMEQKVLNQYKSNVEKLKHQIKDKQKQNDRLNVQIDALKDKNRKMQLLYESRVSRQRSQSALSLSNGKEMSESEHMIQEFDQNQNQDPQAEINPYQRILNLQNQLKQSQDINIKLQEMDEQIFKQIRMKQQQKTQLMKLLEQKDHKIQQLQEIIELKQAANLGSHLLTSHLESHVSSSNHRSSSKNNNSSQRDSMKSQSSLRYSNMTQSRHIVNHNDRIEIQLSQAGSQFFDQNQSYITNISEIFEKDQFPYEKVQLKRKEQIRLFEKTSSYIKSLKDSINDKNKKIKLLEKKIDSLKYSHQHSHSIGKQSENKYEVSGSTNNNSLNENLDPQFQSVFKDYQSVQLQRKTANHNKRFKNLQHEWKLAIQENNVLANQIQALQQQLEKAQEQQNNLLKIKDLYKQEIRKLITKNDAQSKHYEQQLSKQRKKIEESQSIHNIQTIKQLFIKVIDCVTGMDQQKIKKKRQEKRKELQEFFNVFASLAGIQQAKRIKMIEGIRKMNVSASGGGRSSSTHKVQT